jgi:hypothetical protein
MIFKVASRTRGLTLIGLMAVLATPVVHAKCGCPSDGAGAPAAQSGLGQEFPVAPDLAADAAWQVYEFQRDGIRYTQINDQYGNVRAAVGRIGDTFWTMPIGTDADRVTIQAETQPTGVPKVLFRSDDVEVILYQDGATQRWQVRTPSSF